MKTVLATTGTNEEHKRRSSQKTLVCLVCSSFVPFVAKKLEATR
jgi:hypothetical protein